MSSPRGKSHIPQEIIVPTSPISSPGKNLIPQESKLSGEDEDSKSVLSSIPSEGSIPLASYQASGRGTPIIKRASSVRLPDHCDPLTLQESKALLELDLDDSVEDSVVDGLVNLAEVAFPDSVLPFPCYSCNMFYDSGRQSYIIRHL
jgi:hypothetical protein